MAPTIIERLEDIAPPGKRGRVHVAVGTFDGVHVGHRALLQGVVEAAAAEKGRAVVFTFQNHPREVVGSRGAPGMLAPWSLKKRLLSQMGLDTIIGIRFDSAFSMLTAEEFVRDVIVGRCGATSIHAGWSFRFGAGGRGDGVLLHQMAASHDFRYHPVTPVEIGNEAVTSTRIRGALARGAVGDAAQLLGRPHQIAGTVISGDAIGRTLGFPTANLEYPVDGVLPSNGVYGVSVCVGDEARAYLGMMNIGLRPTVGGSTVRAEVHLLDFEGDLLGKSLRVGFLARLRDEQRFENMDALVVQLIRDRTAAGALKGPGPV